MSTWGDDRQLDLIAKLLRQAEGTTHKAEAEAFMARAQTLATRHSIDLAMARAHTAKAERRERPEERVVRIGPAGQRGLAMYVRLFLVVAHANDVQCLVQSDSTLVYALGFPSDIELVETLYASLVTQMVTAGDRYLRSAAFRNRPEQEQWDDRTGRWVVRRTHATTARLAFYRGFVATMGSRLEAAKEEAVSAATRQEQRARRGREPANLPVSTAVVLREKQAEVDAFVADVSEAKGVRGAWRGSRGGRDDVTSRRAGARAARNASLSDRKGIES